MLRLQKQTESEMENMLGQRITLQRKKLGISQAELAQRLCISTSAIGMYEQGRREPSNAILIALSKELHVSIDYLLTGRNWDPGDDSSNALLICPINKVTLRNDKYTVLTLSYEDLISVLSSLLKDR